MNVKENIRDYELKIFELKYRQFNFKNLPEEKRVGLLPEEVPKEFLTKTTAEPEINYVDLVLAKMAELEWRIKRIEDQLIVIKE